MNSSIYNEEDNDESLRSKSVKRIKLEHNVDSNEISATAINQINTTTQSEQSSNQTTSLKIYTKQDLLDYFENEYNKRRELYVDRLLELFFLEENGKLTEYYTWRKKLPTIALLQYFRQIAKDDETEYENLQYDKAKLDLINLSTLKIIPIEQLKLKAAETQTISSSAGQHQTISTTLSTSTITGSVASSLNQSPFTSSTSNVTSLSSSNKDSSSHSITHHHSNATTTPQQQFVTPSVASLSKSNVNSQSLSSKNVISSPFSTPTYHSPNISGTGELAQLNSSQFHFSKSLPTTPISLSTKKSSRFHHTLSTPISPFHIPITPTSSANISSVYESSIGSKEQIVERAKQEASVIQRIAELRKEGLWSAKRLPRIQEPSRDKAHWDFLLEEMNWLATDFELERKWKRTAAKKCARMIMKYHADKESQVAKAEKENLLRLKKIASTISKEIKQFWSSVEKLVDFKIQTKLEEKRKKALDIHLSYIVDQTEKYSSWLAEGLNKNPSLEEQQKTENEQEEESEIDKSAMDQTEPVDTSANLDKGDDEFNLSEDEEDFEDTIAEQEKVENKNENAQELLDLEDEANIPIEKLLERYRDLYDKSDESMDAEEIDETENEEDESEDDDDEEDEQTSGNDEDKNEEIGVEYLVNLNESTNKSTSDKKSEPTIEITDIAAGAESIQPKGNTLSTVQVQTKVPFLLKGQLREYQLIGLDWLVQMYEKHLNGILADEMGLGKTIQTIALIAHLACEKGIWGPHLVIVPTSVMLNWEMEFKKWCPAFKIITYYGSPKERKLKRQGWSKPNQFHVCITSYKLVLQDHQSFRRKKWRYLILDEAQHIKNFKSQRWQMLLNFNTSRRLLLTGTPLQNNLMELWSLMHFLMPNVFKSHRDFKDWFVNPVNDMIEGKQEVNAELISRLHKILRPFLLRRIKADVEKQLPKKYEHVLTCRLSKRQRFLYEEFMSLTKTKETLATGNFLSVINILMQLRKVCNHPNLFETRSVQSPFSMSSLTYSTATLCTTPIDYEPFKNVDLNSFNGNLVDLCTKYNASDIHRIKALQVPSKMIEEIDQIDLESPPNVPVVKFTNKSQILSNCRSTVSHSLRIRNNLQQQNSLMETDELKKPNQTTSIVTRKQIQQPTIKIEKLLSNNSKSTNHNLNDSENVKKQSTITTVELRRDNERNHKLKSLARVNKMKCNRHTLYTKDLLNIVDVQSSPRLFTNKQRDNFNVGQGYFNCLHNQNKERKSVDYDYYNDTLTNILRTPEELIEKMSNQIDKFTFVIPSVRAPKIEIHIPHQPPSKRNFEEYFENILHYDLVKRTACLHKIISNMATQFPELRLIQYDCGKLQTLDKLLWELKAGGHRALIFTQMSRMLDIFEHFLNYHGHTYLRLDGSTKIEQRQALMERFNADKRIFCFILSTRSGGVGVNLTGADTVIFYDSDWNPSIDSQAQDRCHRIGQTRDVHIYRLISEKTVEENILKKARQKKFLGDVAIEGGNFTTAFFKNDSIREIFNVNSEPINAQGLLQNTNSESTRPLIEEIDDEKTSKLKSQLGQALHAAEEEIDVVAAKSAIAEASAEFAEFDESIPFDVDKNEEKSPEEEELERIVHQLTPVERYAMQFLESIQEPIQAEQLKQAEEEIEAQKKEWELGHLKSLKEKNERALKEQEQDELLTMSKEEISQIYISHLTEDVMPTWAPPTPPQDENDLYYDYSMTLMYDSEIMTESQLPPVFVPKESKRIRLENITNRKQAKIRKDENINIPRSLFDKPSPSILKLRKEVKVQKLRGLITGGPDINQLQRILSSFGSNYTLPQPTTLQQQAALSKSPNLILHGTQQESQIHWGINEDWALVEIIQYIQELPINLLVLSPAHIPNWDFVSAYVNSKTSTYRSPKLCRHHYETVILPKEGRGTSEPPTKKLKKLQKQAANQQAASQNQANVPGSSTATPLANKNQPAPQIRPVKISNLFVQDNNNSFTQLMNTRFNNILTIANKRQPTLKPVFINQAGKNPKHLMLLQESNINYDQPLLPTLVAQNRAERIAREKAREAREKAQLTEQNIARQQKLIQLQKQQQQIIQCQTPIKNVPVNTNAVVQQSPTQTSNSNIVISTNASVNQQQQQTAQFQTKINPNALNVSKASVQFVATPTNINTTNISQQQILNIAKGLHQSAANFQLQNSQQQQQAVNTAVAQQQNSTGIQAQIIPSPSVSVSNVIQTQAVPRTITGANISVNQTALPRIVTQTPVSITTQQSGGSIPSNTVYSVTSIPNQSKILTATITNSNATKLTPTQLTPAQLAACRPQFVLQRPITSQLATGSTQQTTGNTQLISNRVQIATNNLIHQPTSIQTSGANSNNSATLVPQQQLITQQNTSSSTQNIVRQATTSTLIATSNTPHSVVPVSSSASTGNQQTGILNQPKISDIQIIQARNPRVQPPVTGQQIQIASLAKPVSSATGQLQMTVPISSNQHQKIFTTRPSQYYARKPTDEELGQIFSNRNQQKTQNITVATSSAVQTNQQHTTTQPNIVTAASTNQQQTSQSSGSLSLPALGQQVQVQFLHIPANTNTQQISKEGPSSSTSTPTFFTIYTNPTKGSSNK